MRMQLDGIVPQIMSAPPQMLEQKPLDPLSGKSWSYPPTYFMHMELDQVNAERVTADIGVLKSKQVWLAVSVSGIQRSCTHLCSHNLSPKCRATFTCNQQPIPREG